MSHSVSISHRSQLEHVEPPTVLNSQGGVPGFKDDIGLQMVGLKYKDEQIDKHIRLMSENIQDDSEEQLIDFSCV